MADTPHDKPVIKVEGSTEDLHREVKDGAAAHLSDQALAAQIADSQRKAGDRTVPVSFETASADGAIAKSPASLAESHGKAFGNLPADYQNTVFTTIRDYVAQANKENNPQLAAAMSAYEPALRQFTQTA